MKKEFLDYLKSLKISNVMLENIMRKHDILLTFMDIKEFDDIFISETRLENGDKVYFELWGFFEDRLGLIHITKSNIGVFKIGNYVSNITATPTNFDFKTANEKSKLEVKTRRVDSANSAEFQCTGENCLHFFLLIKKYLLKNLIKNE